MPQANCNLLQGCEDSWPMVCGIKLYPPHSLTSAI